MPDLSRLLQRHLAAVATTAAVVMALALPASAQPVSALQAVPLRADKASASEVRAQLVKGQMLELLQLDGGWALVRGSGSASSLQGWVRASALDLDAAPVADASRLETGRRAAGNQAVPLGIRGVPLPPAREGRHALIVGVGQYRADAARPVPALAGVPVDMRNALDMARRLQIPADNITLLRDAGATREAVQQALAALAARVRPGDRVFVYWSGHGSRYFDASEGGCVETLVPHDLQDIGNRQFAQWLQPVAGKAGKLMVVYDACHSGGVGAANLAASAAPSRGLAGGWVAKAAAAGEAACLQPSNLRTRSFESAARDLGLDAQDVVHLSSSRRDEVSFDHASTGGMATHWLSRCMAGEARDLDGSGAISMEELAACAQDRIVAALSGQTQLLPQHLVLTGNRGFVPAHFAQPNTPAPGAVAQATSSPGPASPTRPVPAPAATTAVPLHKVLAQVHDQRDSQRKVGVALTREVLRIGQDPLDLAITSSHAGHVYVALAGSDQRSLYLLFPNALDADNRIAAGQTLMLPRDRWRVTAGGPPGQDTLLVMVTDGPRDLSTLAGASAGPFMKPLTDAAGRARLQELLGQRSGAACRGPGCSDGFGSALVTVEER